MNFRPAPPTPAAPVASLAGRSLPQWVEAELTKLRAMRSGEGINNQLFHVAKGMAPFRPDAVIFAQLREATAECGRHVPDSEIVNALNSSKAKAWRPAVAGAMPATIDKPAPAKWPEVNAEQREAVIRGAGPGFERAALWEQSPRRLVNNLTEHYIDALFPGDPLLCVGKTKSIFDTRRREDWRGHLAGQQFIVPSPMSNITGLTLAGTLSKHSLANTGPRHYAVIESDRGSVDEQAAILWHLRFQRGFPLVLVVHSGGKSLHGWFDVRNLSEAKVEAFYRYCVSLGADLATFTRSQFVRLPDGVREDGRPQTVDYFDPLLIQQEIQS